MRDRAACMVNSFRCKILFKKASLAVLTDERNAAMYDEEVFELLQAIDVWRRKSHRSFPAWSEVIQIMKGLGWRKIAEPTPETPATVVAPEPVVDPIEPVPPKAE